MWATSQIVPVGQRTNLRMGQFPNLQEPGAPPLERMAHNQCQSPTGASYRSLQKTANSHQTCLMPQSLSLLLVHLVFSTKNREPWIRAAIESELFAYGTTVLTTAGCPTLAMNGTADHVHVLLNLSRTQSISPKSWKS